MKIKEIRKRAGDCAGHLLLEAGYPSKEAIRTAASLGADLVSDRAPALVAAIDAHIAGLRALRKDVVKQVKP